MKAAHFPVLFGKSSVPAPRLSFSGSLTVEKGSAGPHFTLVILNPPAGVTYTFAKTADPSAKFTLANGDEVTVTDTSVGGPYEGDWEATPSDYPTHPKLDLTTLATVADTVAPVLTLPTDTKTGSTTATLTVTTDTGEGTLYAVCTTSSTPPSAAQVIAGQDHSGVAAAFANSVAVASTGLKTVSATGLTAATAYTTFFVQKDASNNVSLVSAADGFTTDSANSYAALQAILSGNSGGIWDPAGTNMCWQDTGKSTPAGNGDPVRVIADADGVNDLIAADDASRPIRRQDGSGAWYLDFSAASSMSLVTGTMQLTSTAHGEWFAGAGTYFASLPSAIEGILLSDGVTRVAQQLRINTSNNLDAVSFSGGGAASVNTDTAVFSATTFYRVTSEANYNGGSPQLTAYVNNVANTPTSVSDFATAQSYVLFMGSGRGDSYLTGRIYRAFYVARSLTSGEKASVDAFLNGNHP